MVLVKESLSSGNSIPISYNIYIYIYMYPNISKAFTIYVRACVRHMHDNNIRCRHLGSWGQFYTNSTEGDAIARVDYTEYNQYTPWSTVAQLGSRLHIRKLTCLLLMWLARRPPLWVTKVSLRSRRLGFENTHHHMNQFVHNWHMPCWLCRHVPMSPSHNIYIYIYMYIYTYI